MDNQNNFELQEPSRINKLERVSMFVGGCALVAFGPLTMYLGAVNETPPPVTAAMTMVLVAGGIHTIKESRKG